MIHTDNVLVRPAFKIFDPVFFAKFINLPKSNVKPTLSGVYHNLALKFFKNLLDVE